MKTFEQKRVNRRALFLTFFFLFWLGGLVLRLIQLQIVDHAKAREDILEQNQNKMTIQPLRGTIFDRKGNILVRSIPRESVFYHPSEDSPIDDEIKNILKLKTLLDLSDKDLRRTREQIKKHSPFIWIKRKIEDATTERVREMDVAGIHFQEEKKRFYPNGRMAAHILGRVNMDGLGQSGLEYFYNSVLAGREGSKINFFDARRRKYRFETTQTTIDGNDIMLTIDETIQYIAEKELKKAVRERNAGWGTVIVSKPLSGEILAMAHYPSFDPNVNPESLELTDKIKAVHHLFDPGSTFKIITASAALEYGKADLHDSFDCSANSIKVAGKEFHDHARFDILTFPQVIIHSSNVGTIQLGQKIGSQNLYAMIKKFGFGQRTGIDLPGEYPGIFRPLEKWNDLSLASLSIGYEISVTPIQMLMVVNTIANRGIYTPPRLVKKIMTANWEEIRPHQEQKKIISEYTAREIESMLRQVVLEGTGTEAGIDGYMVVGKTGTAQKIDPVTKEYTSSAHTASFVGYVSTETPLFSILVVIDDPKGLYYGGQVSAPVFREIASQILRYFKIPRRADLSDKILMAGKNGSPDG